MLACDGRLLAADEIGAMEVVDPPTKTRNPPRDLAPPEGKYGMDASKEIGENGFLNTLDRPKVVIPGPDQGKLLGTLKEATPAVDAI